jgi:hypothetical protein
LECHPLSEGSHDPHTKILTPSSLPSCQYACHFSPFCFVFRRGSC